MEGCDDFSIEPPVLEGCKIYIVNDSNKPIMHAIFLVSNRPPFASSPVQTVKSVQQTQLVTKPLLHDLNHWTSQESPVFSCSERCVPKVREAKAYASLPKELARACELKWESEVIDYHQSSQTVTWIERLANQCLKPSPARTAAQKS